MTKFRCSKCNFVFEKEKQPFLCPYCGKSESVYEESDASELLREVDELLE